MTLAKTKGKQVRSGLYVGSYPFSILRSPLVIEQAKGRSRASVQTLYRCKCVWCVCVGGAAQVTSAVGESGREGHAHWAELSCAAWETKRERDHRLDSALSAKSSFESGVRLTLSLPLPFSLRGRVANYRDAYWQTHRLGFVVVFVASMCVRAGILFGMPPERALARSRSLALSRSASAAHSPYLTFVVTCVSLWRSVVFSNWNEADARRPLKT